jgi:hypothetical protein
LSFTYDGFECCISVRPAAGWIGERLRSRRSAWNRLGDKYIVRIAANAAVNATGVGSFFWRSFAEPPRGNGPASIGGADE